MTTPVDDGRPPITAPGIHDKPAEKPRAPFTQRQLRAIGDALVNQILARVLLAVAGIEVPLLGKPFAFLAAWAKELQDRANDAYAGAMGAQSSANYANAQLIKLAGSGLATEVTGGVAINEFFDGSSANDLGANFTRRSDGPGGGGFGPNGSGLAVWKKSGGQARTHWDTHVTALATRYQVVMTLVQAKIIPGYNQVTGLSAYTMLRARISSSNDETFVYAQIFSARLVVGCYVAGTNHVFDTVNDVPWTDGDVVHFLVGTDDDDYEFIVKRNGVPIWRDIDTGHVSQVDSVTHLRVGLTSRAADRGSGAFFNSTQTPPAQLEVWAAADRLAASI